MKNVNLVDDVDLEDKALEAAARVVDLINRAYTLADEEGYANLAGVSVVLEGYANTGLTKIDTRWDDSEGSTYEVAPLADIFPSA